MLRMLPRPRGRPRGPYGPSRAATAPLRDFPPLLLPALDACWPRARSQPTCGSELPRRAAFRRPRCASSLPRWTPRARAIPPAQSGAQACSASASEVASSQVWARTIRRLQPTEIGSVGSVLGFFPGGRGFDSHWGRTGWGQVSSSGAGCWRLQRFPPASTIPTTSPRNARPVTGFRHRPV